MTYINFETGKNVYRLRLNTRNLILLEKLLGGSPLKVFTGLSEENPPTVELMVNILYASLLAFHKDITLDETYDIFDEWIEEGHIMAEFIGIIVDLYKDAGLIQKGKAEKN